MDAGEEIAPVAAIGCGHPVILDDDHYEKPLLMIVRVI